MFDISLGNFPIADFHPSTIHHQPSSYTVDLLIPLGLTSYKLRLYWTYSSNPWISAQPHSITIMHYLKCFIHNHSLSPHLSCIRFYTIFTSNFHIYVHCSIQCNETRFFPTSIQSLLPNLILAF